MALHLALALALPAAGIAAASGGTDGADGAAAGSAGGSSAEVAALREENEALKTDVAKAQYRVNILVRALTETEEKLEAAQGGGAAVAMEDVRVST